MDICSFILSVGLSTGKFQDVLSNKQQTLLFSHENGHRHAPAPTLSVGKYTKKKLESMYRQQKTIFPANIFSRSNSLEGDFL
jgi:hypothetical protein